MCDYYPEIIREAVRREWELMGHGFNNSQTLGGLSREDERAVIQASVAKLSAAAGRPTKGWLGPGLVETFNTLEILAEAGVEYVSDWCNDDQPYPIEVSGGRLIGVPYCMEVNDIYAFVGAGMDGESFYRMMCDQFDVLHAEGAAYRPHPRPLPAPFHRRPGAPRQVDRQGPAVHPRPRRRVGRHRRRDLGLVLRALLRGCAGATAGAGPGKYRIGAEGTQGQEFSPFVLSPSTSSGQASRSEVEGRRLARRHLIGFAEDLDQREGSRGTTRNQFR